MSESLKNDVLKAVKNIKSNILIKTNKPLKIKNPKDIYDK